MHFTKILVIISILGSTCNLVSAQLTDTSTKLSVADLEQEITRLRTLIDSAKNEENAISKENLASSPEQKKEAQELSQNKIKLYQAMIVITAIVGISIGFEICKDYLEENTREAMKPILRNIFGELTILGFIGLVMFLVTKYGKKAINQAAYDLDFRDECKIVNIFGNRLICSENPLIELTETVHMVLFMVMMLFLASAVMLVKIGRKKEVRWRFLEDFAITTPLEVIKRRSIEEEAKFRNKSWWIRTFTSSTAVRDWHERLRYSALRIGFVQTANKNIDDDDISQREHKIQMDFDFAEYIDHEFTKVLSEIVDITPKNWLCIWFLFMVFLAIDYIDLVEGAYTMTVTYAAIIGAYLMSFFLMYVNRHLKYIEGQLIHHEHEIHLENEAKKLQQQGSSINLDMEASGSIPLLDENHLDMHVDHHPAYKYHKDGTEKPPGSVHGHHAGLFWGGLEGLEVLFGYVRVELVMISIYMGCFLVALQGAIWKRFVSGEESGGEDGRRLLAGEANTAPNNLIAAIVLYIVAFIPVLLHMQMYALVLPNLCIVTCTEELIKSKGILRTLRIMKSKNAMQALHNMSCFMHCVDRLTTRMKTDVKNFNCFKNMDAAMHTRLIQEAQIKHFQAGKSILRVGDLNTLVYVIISGEVEVLDASGKVVGEYTQGEEFGETSMLNQSMSTVTFVSRVATIVLMLSKDDFMTFVAPFRQHQEEQSSKDETEVERARRMHVLHNHEKTRSATPKLKKPVSAKHRDRLPEALKFYRRVALSKIFKTIDASGDGDVDQEELETFLADLFPKNEDSAGYKKQLTVMIQALDEDGSGEVDESEFLSMMEPIVEDEEQRETLESMAERMFEILDDDNSGCLTTSEFKESLEKLGVKMSYEEIRELFHEYDEDLDGVLDAEEFVQLMTHQI